jgi:hypothetical protein
MVEQPLCKVVMVEYDRARQGVTQVFGVVGVKIEAML